MVHTEPPLDFYSYQCISTKSSLSKIQLALIASGSQPCTATQLDQLDDYALLAIFDQMEFTDLLNVANQSARFRQLIIDHFMRSKYRLHEKVIKIAVPRDYTMDGNKLIFRDPHQILPFLRNFGHLITSVQFNAYGYDRTAAAQIVRYIERYASESLRTIKQFRGGRHFFGSQTSTFDHVTAVDIESKGPLVDYHLHRIYPRMESLKILLEQSAEASVHAHNSAHLKRLEFHEIRNFANDSFLQSLLRANPQLRSLRLQKAVHPETMRVVRDHLPHLNWLNLVQRKDDFFGAQQPVHLASVHHFVFDVIHSSFDHGNRQFPLTFGRLETLRINSLHLHPQLVDLLAQSGGIKSLSLPMLGSPQLLLPLLRQMERLEDVHLMWSSSVEADEFEELLNAPGQLRTATISVWSGEWHRDLLRKIPNQWQVVKLSGDHALLDVTLVRRNA